MEDMSLSIFNFRYPYSLILRLICKAGLLLLTTFLILTIFALVFPKLAGRIFATAPIPYLGCSGEGYALDSYISYCAHGPELYGHGAIFYDLEHTFSKLSEADVVILGSSRAGFGFSNDVITSYFRNRGLRYFNLFFDSAEQDAFPAIILEMAKSRPKWLVVNLDPFFTGRMSPVADDVVNHSSYLRFYSHRLLQMAHKKVCYGTSEKIKTIFCSNSFTVFRARSSGNISGTFNFPTGTKNETFAFEVSPLQQELSPYLNQARSLIDKGHACLMVVAVPAIQTTTPDLALQIALALNLPHFIPISKTFETFDKSHLTLQSSEDFSRGFIASFEEQEKKCKELSPKND